VEGHLQASLMAESDVLRLMADVGCLMSGRNQKATDSPLDETSEPVCQFNVPVARLERRLMLADLSEASLALQYFDRRCRVLQFEIVGPRVGICQIAKHKRRIG
jgi:hypothetical protein